jgi:hypothetical protein
LNLASGITDDQTQKHHNQAGKLSEPYHLKLKSTPIMPKRIIGRVSTDSLLVALTKLDPSNIPKKDLKHFDEDLLFYAIFTAPDDGSDAKLVGNIAPKDEVVQIRRALKQIHKSPTFTRLDGVKRLVYHCTKAEILSLL